MTSLDIEAIRDRAAKAEAVTREDSPSNYRLIVVIARSARDVPVLLAEVERLTVEARDAEFEVVRQRGEQARLRKAHDELISHCTFVTEELDRVRGWNDEIKAERDALALAALDHEGEMREAGAEIRNAQAATADALQVIADLRGGTP